MYINHIPNDELNEALYTHINLQFQNEFGCGNYVDDLYRVFLARPQFKDVLTYHNHINGIFHGMAFRELFNVK